MNPWLAFIIGLGVYWVGFAVVAWVSCVVEARRNRAAERAAKVELVRQALMTGGVRMRVHRMSDAEVADRIERSWEAS